MRSFFLSLALCGLTAGPVVGQGFGGLLNAAKRAKEEVSKRQVPAAASQRGTTTATEPGQRPAAGDAAQHVFFASTPFGETLPATTRQEFSSTDHIYGRLQLEGTVEESLDVDRNELGGSVDITVRIRFKEHEYDKLEKNESLDFTYLLTPAMLKQRYLNFDLFEVATQGLPRFIELHSVRHLPPAAVLCPSTPWVGSAVVKFDFLKPELNGTFTLAPPATGTASAACRAVQQFQQKTVAGQGLPDDFRQASGTFQDPQLSAAALRRLFQASGGVEVYRLVIETGPDYTIVKNELGIPLYKITKSIYNTYRATKTGLCYYTHNAIRREYQGGGSFGPPTIANLAVNRVQIDCALAKGGK